MGGFVCVDVVCWWVGVFEGFYFCAVVQKGVFAVEDDGGVAERAEAFVRVISAARCGAHAEYGTKFFTCAEFGRYFGEADGCFGYVAHFCGAWFSMVVTVAPL